MKNFKLDFVPPHESAFPNVRGSVRIFSLPKQMQTIPIGVVLRATTSIAQEQSSRWSLRNVSARREARLQGAPREGPESAP